MPVLTYSFNSGYNGWTFNDNSASAYPGKNACPTCSATRSYVTGAIRNTLVVASLANVAAWGQNFSPTELGVTVQNGDTIEVDVSATSDAAATQEDVYAIYTDATYETVSSAGSGATTVTLTLTQNKTLDYIRVDVVRSTSGSAIGSTSYRDILEVRLTTAGAIDPTPGKLRAPKKFIEDQGAGAAGGAGGGFDNVADISADGLYIYIAAFDNLGFPTLIRIAATLSANGTVVFQPGAGGRIGVECEKFSADNVWVAGAFDGTNTVEQSEDDGATWTVKDDGTFGAIRTFRIGPDSDNRIILFDGDNGDIIESIDGGESWTTINAAVSPLINSIARFAQNPPEIVAGNEGDVTDSIDYSPNSGANLEDYQTGVYPATDGTKVIAN